MSQQSFNKETARFTGRAGPHLVFEAPDGTKCIVVIRDSGDVAFINQEAADALADTDFIDMRCGDLQRVARKGDIELGEPRLGKRGKPPFYRVSVATLDTSKMSMEEIIKADAAGEMPFG